MSISQQTIRWRVALLAAAVLTAASAAPAGAQATGGGAASPPNAAKPGEERLTIRLGTPWKDAKDLRVCSDPDNMPFSNQKREGFDNRIAELIARDLGDSVTYAWFPARRGFIRNTLGAHLCDVVIGVPKGYDPVATSRPYYRSTYFLVYRKDSGLDIKSLDDPRLKQLRIGVNLIGEDYTNTPPAHALSRHGIDRNVAGFSSFYGEEHYPGEIIDSLVAKNIDVAIVWGPLAGYFANRAKVPLTLVALPDDNPDLPFTYDITIGTRRSDRELRARIDDILERRKPEIDAILQEFHVPRLDASP